MKLLVPLSKANWERRDHITLSFQGDGLVKGHGVGQSRPDVNLGNIEAAVVAGSCRLPQKVR